MLSYKTYRRLSNLTLGGFCKCSLAKVAGSHQTQAAVDSETDDDSKVSNDAANSDDDRLHEGVHTFLFFFDAAHLQKMALIA